MKAQLINVAALYTAVVAFFISAAWAGCQRCFVCAQGEDSCLDSDEDMSLALAVAK